MTALTQQAAAVERSVVNLRGFLERRGAQSRWPESDIERGRRLLADMQAAAITMRRLADREHDARFADLIREIVE